ncbi:MAG: insulinase family protein [Planctomycetes bacterium]|nr:insulinase family protein [Planctomycetota bacterium]MCC7395533.1 insulinase family protein [Planctomycetota bacterium]
MATIRLNIAERVLPSGLTLLAVHNPGVQTYACAVSLDVRVGDEDPKRSGVANLVGECLDEGTRRYDALGLSAAAESLGAMLDGNHRGGVVMSPASSQREATELLREMVLEPTFPGREVRRVQAEVLTEIRAEEDDPRTVAARRFRREVYGEHPLARPPQGFVRTLQELGPKDLREFHDAWFRPAGGYVAAAGPDDPERTLDRLEKTFRGLRGKAPKHPAVPTLELAPTGRDVHLPMPREQVHVFLGHLGIRRDHADYYVLSVMDHVLGTGPGFTSRCSRKLRDEQGLCYSVSAGITASAGEEQGTFTAYIGTSPEHRQRAIDGFLEEIRRIRTEPVSATELQDVKDYLTGSFVFALERNSNLAAFAIRARRFGLGFDFLQRYPDIVRGITAEQVCLAAERHLHPDRLVAVSAGAS